MALFFTRFFTQLQHKFHNISIHVNNVGIATFTRTKVYDAFINYQLKKNGVNFKTTPIVGAAGNTVSSSFKDAHENQPSSFYAVKEGLKKVPIAHNKIILLDIGCGNGSILNYAMLLHFKKAIGIELDNKAINKALINCNRLKEKGFETEFEIINTDAVTYYIPEIVNVIYLFNPFGNQTMEKVVTNIINHAKKWQKEIYVIYNMPSYQQCFEWHPECKKIYERLNKNKTMAELSVFKIIP